jgi:hypothetical protein
VSQVDHGLDDRGVEFQLRVETRDSSLLHSIQSSSGANSPSHTMCAEVDSLGGEADHSSPPSAEATDGGAMPPLPSTPSWCWLRN